jgi:hypothetical protein
VAYTGDSRDSARAIARSAHTCADQHCLGRVAVERIRRVLRHPYGPVQLEPAESMALKDPSSFAGTPCTSYPNDTTCWDASAIRLDNPGSTDVTGVHAVVIGTKTYDLWGSSLIVKAGGMLVLTETGSSKNSENFDGSDFPPNSYNGGNTASPQSIAPRARPAPRRPSPPARRPRAGPRTSSSAWSAWSQGSLRPEPAGGRSPVRPGND